MKSKHETIRISTPAGRLKLIVLRYAHRKETASGILWIHGGGYMVGMAGMVYMSRGRDLAKKFGGVVVSPGYRQGWQAPYPAALEDCYAALNWMWDHADELGIDHNRIVVGGESAGGGLAAAVCLYARDQGKIKVSLQLPLYPMLDCEDTPSSSDNHGRVWNTRKNHWGWRHYLGNLYGTDEVPKYASAARETDYSNLPPCYTFVSEGEPFRDETLAYVDHLKQAGVDATADVYPGDVHAFDMLCPWRKSSKEAKSKLCSVYEAWLKSM